MAILVGIDGTGGGVWPGASRNARYDLEFKNSFVRRLHRGGGQSAKYFRGPVTLGGGLVEAVRHGVRHVKEAKAASPNEDVLLTGYSRGAAGVVAVATALKRSRIEVRALLLFDCVDRHVFIDAEVIPNNVGHVMHVIRDSRSKSRESFGNDGLRYEPPVDYPAAYEFLCTHGGMGGVPWQPEGGKKETDLINEGGLDGMTTISYAEDKRVSAQVWAFVQPFIQKHGFVDGGVS